MSTDSHPTRRGPDRGLWLLFVAIIGLIAVFAVGFYFLFDWADEQSPWFLRIVILFFATLIGYRLGRAMKPNPPFSRDRNWTAIGVAFLAAAVAGYFGVYRPVQCDAEFRSLLDEGRVATEHLAAVARDTPEPDSNEPVTLELRERNVAALERAIAWMKRFQGEIERYSKDQVRQLQDEFHRLREAQQAATEKVARHKKKPKDE